MLTKGGPGSSAPLLSSTSHNSCPTWHLAYLSLMQFNVMPIFERPHGFCSKSLNSLGNSDRVRGLVWITPFSVLCTHFFDDAANWGQQHQRPLFSGGCLGKAVLSPHRPRGIRYLLIPRSELFEADPISNCLIIWQYVRSCVSVFVSRYVSSSFPVPRFLFKKFRTPFPKVFSPKT